MTEQLSSNGRYDANEYFRYKSHEKEALKILFKGDDHKQQSVQEIYRAAEQAVPLLSRGDLDLVLDHLEKSTVSRRNFSVRYRFAPKRSQTGHAYWAGMMQRICELAQQTVSNTAARDQHGQERLALLYDRKDSEQYSGDHVKAEQEQSKELEDSPISADQAIFLRFLEEIESCVAEAEALWERVVSKELDPSTAAILTSTYVCTIKSMIGAENLLSPSWFEGDCLAKSLSGLNSAYWAELEACTRYTGDIFMYMVYPLLQSGTRLDHEPALIQLLTSAKRTYPCKTIFDTPLVIAVAASLACRLQKLIGPTKEFLQELRSSVEKQILSIEPILQRHKDIYKDHITFLDMSELVGNIKKWATLCHDPVSFGYMMSWLKVKHVLCIRLFLFESSILQLFAYIYERIRLRDKIVHVVLEDLFNNQRISDFIFLYKRPKNLEECTTGIERWSDPAGISSNLQRIQHIFRSRYKSTMAEQVMERMGGVTREMVKQLNGKTLENHLRWELELPDPIRLEAILIDAVSSTAKRNSIKSAGEAWGHLRTKILNRPKKERELLSRFMESFPSNSLQDIELC